MSLIEKGDSVHPCLIYFDGYYGDTMKDNRFYVYLHKIKETDEIFYVGKGTGYRHVSKYGRSKIWKNVTENSEWYSEIIKDGLSNDEACDMELDLIKTINPIANVHKKDIRQKLLNREFILSRYMYDAESPSGLVYKTWNGQEGSKRRNEGDIAGTYCKNMGYYSVSNGGNRGSVRAHRVVWLILKGEDPYEFIIDHLDGNRSNNNINNLEKKTQKENSKNQSRIGRNKTGVVGVHKNKEGTFYSATWIEESLKPKQISFSIAKHGEEMAFNLACYYRYKMTVNSGFTSRHLGEIPLNILNKYTEEDIKLIIEDELVSSNTSGISSVYFQKFGKFEYWGFADNNNKKYFSCAKYGNTLAKHLAVAYKERYFTGKFSEINNYSLNEINLMLDDDTKTSNTSGFKGLQFKLLSSGETVVTTQKMINYKNYTKRFSCKEYGLIKAHSLALIWYETFKG